MFHPLLLLVFTSNHGGCGGGDGDGVRGFLNEHSKIITNDSCQQG